MTDHHQSCQIPIEPANVTMRVGCAYTGDSRTAMYDAIGKGEVEAVKEGRQDSVGL